MEVMIAGLSPDPNGDPVIRKGISDIVLADAWPDCGHPRPQKLTERRLRMIRKRPPTEARARAECERITSTADEEQVRAFAPETAGRAGITKEKGPKMYARLHRLPPCTIEPLPHRRHAMGLSAKPHG